MRSSSGSGTEETLVSAPRSMAAGTAPAVGQRIARYIVVHPIGAGAMGTVVAAYDPELDRKVAIKLLHARDTDHADLLRGEAQTLAQLNHPNVVAVYDVGVIEAGHDEGGSATVFLAMEFVDGSTLRRWVADGSHSVAEIVDAFVLAGRGLAAAHAAGIVHRDFKPDNVLVARDMDGSTGVCVVDFGIAERDPAFTTSPSSLRSTTPLRTRAVAGTPAYMAPEQHRGAEVDHRADQFSFCVALFEALAGVRPFDVTALGPNADDPSLPLTTPRTVPRWARPVLARGLSLDPKRRYDSMHALLDALSRASPRRRRRRLALALAAGCVGLGGWAVARWSAPASCPDPQSQIQQTWDPAARARVEAAFSASTRPFAASSASSVTAAIDAWADEWQKSFADACGSGSATPHERELRVSCLESSRARMAAVIDLLETGDADVVEKAGRLVSDLRHEADCEDVRAMHREPPPPDDEALAARVASLRAQLAHVVALRAALRGAAALELAESLAPNIEETGYAPLQAELGIERARVHLMLGAFDDAERDAAVALETAIVAGTDRTAFRAALASAGAARGRERWDDARRWLALADAFLQRLGGSESLAAALEEARFGLALDTHEYDDAELHLLRTHELRALVGHDDVATLADEAGSHAQISYGRGDTPGAAAHMQEALTLLGDSLGPEHPNFVSIEFSLAVIEWELVSLTSALPRARHAAEARARDLGERSPATIRARTNLALMLFTAGDIAAAREMSESCLAAHLELAGDGLAAAQDRGNLALIEVEAGRFARARELIDAAMAGLRREKVPDPVLGVAHGLSGRIAIGEGRHEFALAELERWRTMSGATGVTMQTIEMQLWRAMAESGLGRDDEARASALQVAQGLREIPIAAWVRGKFRLEAARILARTDPTAARELAELAASDARSEGQYARHTLAAAESLMATLAP